MTSNQTLFVTALFVAVLAFAFFMFRWALRHRSRTTERLASLSVVPPSAWRRFARALGAMYLLAPPAMRSGRPDNDAVFFGLGAHRAAEPIEPRLRSDWGVADEASAERALAAGWTVAAERVRRSGTGAATRATGATGALRPLDAPAAPVDELLGAWQRREAGASLEQAYGAALPAAAERAAQDADAAGVAFDIARHVHLARMAAQAGWIAPAREEAWGDRFALLAWLAFPDWDRYGADFEDGMRAFRGGGVTGALYDRSVEQGLRWLRADPGSPWTRVRWPESGSGSAGAVAGGR